MLPGQPLKTLTFRNVAVTLYMQYGSLKTLKEIVDHYNNGKMTKKKNPVNDFLGSGIRPLDLTEQEVDDLFRSWKTPEPPVRLLSTLARTEVKP
jgi:cytochrome c peroxidase